MYEALALKGGNTLAEGASEAPALYDGA